MPYFENEVLSITRARNVGDFKSPKEVIDVIKESDILQEHWKNYQSKFSYAEEISYEDTMKVLEEIKQIL